MSKVSRICVNILYLGKMRWQKQWEPVAKLFSDFVSCWMSKDVFSDSFEDIEQQSLLVIIWWLSVLPMNMFFVNVSLSLISKYIGGKKFWSFTCMILN